MGCCEKSGPRQFRPNYNENPLTPKFYARHDAIPEKEIKVMAQRFEKELEKRYHYDLRRLRYTPLTENQSYGWLEHCIMKKEPIITKLNHHPLRTDPAFKSQAEIWRAVMKYSFLKK